MIYAVVCDYTFDYDCRVKLFADYEKAKEYLQKDWENTFNLELNESVLDMDECYHEDDYAQIKWGFDDNQIQSWKIVECSVSENEKEELINEMMELLLR